MKTEVKATREAEAGRPASATAELPSSLGTERLWLEPRDQGQEAGRGGEGSREVGHVNAQSLFFFFSSHLKASCSFLRSA